MEKQVQISNLLGCILLGSWHEGGEESKEQHTRRLFTLLLVLLYGLFRLNVYQIPV